MKANGLHLLWVLLRLAVVLGATAQDNGTDRSPHQAKFITVNGVKLQYLDWGGEGETLLFLHGFGDTPHIFDGIAPKFTNQFHVLALTRRGHGQSEIPDSGYDTATRVEDIRQFLDALKIPRAVLTGHSMAGGELTLLAGMHPERVIKLVYLDAVFDIDRRQEMARRSPPEMNPTPADIESLDRLRLWIQRMNNGWSDAWEATLRQHFSPDGLTYLNSEQRNRAMSAMIAEGTEARQDYTKVRSPSLNITVVGFPSNMVNHFKSLPEPKRRVMDEFLTSVSQAKEKEIERFRKELPGARVVVLTNADHHCFIDREADVLREMREFLSVSEERDSSPHQAKFITVNGVKLHYLDWGGAGETLLFLHGMGDTAHVYDGFAPRFTNQFRVLGLTRRGHGESGIPETGYDTATLVEDIRQFLDALKIQRVVLAGHSFAGDELTRFAIAHPDRTIKLIYFDSAYDHSRVPESLRFKPLHGGRAEHLPTKEESASPAGARRWINRLFGEQRGRVMYSMMEGTYSETHEYGKIKAPALAFFAIGYKQDVDAAKTLPGTPRQNVLEFLKRQRKYHEQEIEHFRKEIPDGRAVVFTNAVHPFPLEREEEVVREMRAFLAPAGSQSAQMSLPLPIDVEIPMPPAPVKADGKWWLVYELHVTNFHTNNVELVRVEVLRSGTKTVLAAYADQELGRRLVPATSIRLPLPGQVERVIGPTMRAVVYLLLAVEREADVPAALHHRLFFKSDSAAGNSEEVVEGGQVTVSRKKPLVLSPPLRGEGWVAARGPSNDSVHRRASVVIGKARIPQRFAIDWLRIDADGKPVRSPYRYLDGGGLDFETRDEAKNANWRAYGAEVLAVANAVVAEVKDGIPENEMGSGERAVPITLETVAGNYVILDLGKNNFALYAHLQPKSIRVHVGQKVGRGQVLALLGNSGHSDGPHLHFQVTDGNSVVGAEGVPYVFESFEVQGVIPSGQLGNWKPPSTAKADKRRREIPTDSSVVRFP